MKKHKIMKLIDQIFGFKKRKDIDSTFGRTTAVVYSAISPRTRTRTVCIVDIKREADHAEIKIYDSNDVLGTSVTNMIEYIATGVYLEHLAKDYEPSEIKFIHRRYIEWYHWGNTSVEMTWNDKEGHFSNPEWKQWIPDPSLSEREKTLLIDLSEIAWGAVSKHMLNLEEKGLASERDKKIHERYLEYNIKQKSEQFAYSLVKPNMFSDL